MASDERLRGATVTDDDRAAREEILGRFEAALRQGSAPAIDEYRSGDASRLLLVELVHLDMEYRLNAGEGRRVEGYLSRYPELSEDIEIVRDLLVAEYRFRHRLEHDLGLAEYRRRFPQFGPALEEWLACAAESTHIEAPVPGSRMEAEPWPEDLPDYRILGRLGRGGMGVVYKALQLGLNRTVALKMVRAGADAGPDLLARFQIEAEALAGLQHPNIVAVYEVGRHRGRPYLTMEFLDGGSLHDLLRGRPQPPHTAAVLLETLARAMHCAHLRGIVHRDLKPANILFGSRESGVGNREPDSRLPTPDSLVPKITDFGLAKRLQEGRRQTVTGVIMGTPNYMAPEQAEGRSERVGPLADVYALGAILYEMLTGRPPFEGETQLDTLRKVLSEEPTSPRVHQPTVPRDLSTICLKCLEKDPARRYRSAEAMADDLRRYLNGEPILARRTGLTERILKWAIRRPAQAGLVFVSFMATALLAGTLLYSYWRISIALGEAEENADVALDTVDYLISRMAAERLLDEPGKDPLREELLARAPAIYERLARRPSIEPAVRRQTALAWFRLGDIHRILDQSDRAAAEFLQAIERQEALCRENSETASYWYELAESHNWLGELLREDKQLLLDAEPHYREALDCRRRALELLPEDEEEERRKLLLGVARSHYNLGIVAMDTGRPKEARVNYDQAVSDLSTLLLAAPDDLNCRQDLARALVNRGILNKDDDRLGEALADYKAARDHFETLRRRKRNRVAYKYEYALAQQNLGNLLASMGRVQEAGEAQQDALKLLKELTLDFADRPRYKKKLANSLNSQGIALFDAGDRRGAEQCWMEARNLLQPLVKDPSAASDYKALLGIAQGNLGWLKTKEENWSTARPLIEEALANLHEGTSPQLKRKDFESALRKNTMTLAETLVRLGDHAAAVPAAEQLASLTPEQPLNSYYAACYIARCIPIVAKDTQLRDAETRQALSSRYAERAVVALRQTTNRISDGMPRLKDEAEIFQPLEGRPGFEEALRALDAKTNKPQ